MQPARGDPLRDASVRHAELAQLAASDDPPLPAGEGRNRPIHGCRC
jgi:hypothetical protein